MPSTRSTGRSVLRFTQTLAGLLSAIGFALLVVASFADWHGLLAAVAVALIVSGLTTFLLRYELLDELRDDRLRQSGIEAATLGRTTILEHVGGLSLFLQNARPREIDICGISMYSVLGPGIQRLLVDLAANGFLIRLALADPASPELSLQEVVEGKPGTLKHHIGLLISQIKHLVQGHPKSAELCTHLIVGNSTILPKQFIIRAGNKLVVCSYFHRGPFETPSLFVIDRPEGFFDQYRRYLDDLFTNPTFRRVDLAK